MADESKKMLLPETSMKKPADIQYGLLDRPPLLKILTLALQQIFVVAIYLVLISILAHTAKLSSQQTQVMISLGFVAMGVATLMQAIRGKVGSGFLATACPAITFFAPGIVAAKMGGISLALGMYLLAGIAEIIFANVSKYLRVLFPPVVTGLVFCGLGLEVGIVSLDHILSINHQLAAPMFSKVMLAFSFTLVLMIGLSIWGKGASKLLCLVIGLVAGSVFAFLLGLIPADKIHQLMRASVFAVPIPNYLSFSFQGELLPLFLISAIAAGLRTVGVVVTAQQINDAGWQKADNRSVRGGVNADGLAVVFSSLIGTFPVGVSPSAVGVTKATGATSRVIAYAVAVICLVFAFIPKISALFMLLPTPVISAGLIVTSCIMFVGGIKIITRVPTDLRKTYTIGIAILAGLAPKLFPEFFQQLPSLLVSISQSMLVTIGLTAIIVNLIFHIGRKQRRLIGGDTPGYEKLLNEAMSLGLPRNLAEKNAQVIDKLHQSIVAAKVIKKDFKLTLTYNEIDFIAKMDYVGELPVFVEREDLSADNLVEEQVFILGLSSLFANTMPDNIAVSKDQGRCHITLKFEC